ncbi:conserved exported protein of unknown function [Pseudorhizobium banfieldiae]|uniref:Uncharacterized protein n=1 Tax=Pseudorhizobium banfieldiae TaxID=1125847 RepID=L0NJN4_9HYPH|nr:metallochaperone AztD [Pseudorhizobium banfieldiae]CAD6618592.1 metal-binding protein ZinT [arsenite-oxidising bacterium NT-25]CCF21099.1 conserved exported protein of unknown function [Pseudorhizobium banfieldiae]
MLRLPLIAASSAILIATLSPSRADEVEAWRLLVGDQKDAKLTVLDGATGHQIAQYQLEGYVTHLVASESRKTAFAVQMDADAVDVIATGVTFSDHGEHKDVELNQPAQLGRIHGRRPVHAVPHDDQVLQFFDLEGEARIFDEAALLRGEMTHGVVRSTAPHHGVAVPLGAYMLISEPDVSKATKEGDLPPRLGLKVLNGEGQQVGEIATCTGLHGEASSAGMVAFGCEEGVLIACRGGSGTPELEMLSYGDDMPEGQVGTLLGGRAMQFFLGNYGDDKVVVIDPSQENPFLLVELPVRRVDFALDPARPTTAYVFTEDGTLHVLDILTGRLTRSAQVTEPYSKDGHWRDPRPLWRSWARRSP